MFEKVADGKAESGARGVDRRTLLKAIAAGAAVGAGAAIAASRLVPPFPPRPTDDGFVYVAGDAPNPYGFDQLAGQDARTEDFTQVWAGAHTLWRTLRDDEGTPIPGTGFPVLLIRVDPDLILHPPEWVLGRDFIQDPAILAFWARCTHMCCLAGWHSQPLPPSFQDYEPNRVPRTFLAGQDPLWCRCHDAQFDPLTLEWDRHPGGIVYMAARLSHRPATRGLPAVSIEARNGRVVGGKFDLAPPRAPPNVLASLGGRNASSFRDWYLAYCR